MEDLCLVLRYGNGIATDEIYEKPTEGMIEWQSSERIGQGIDHDVLHYLGPCASIQSP